MGLEEASGLKEARKERNSIPRAVYNVEKWKRAAAGPKECKRRKYGVYGRPMNLKDENKIIGSGKPNEVSKSLWECRISKMAKEAQRKQMGQGCLRERQKGHRSP